MHEQPPDELRTLRERAYGPAPDIHDDPAALARLRQLEAEASAVRAASVPENRDAAPLGAEDVAPDPLDAQLAEDQQAAGTEPAPDSAPDPARTRRWTPSRWAWVWAGALTAALVAGAGITYASLQARPGSVAILAPDAAAPWPENFGNRPAGAQVFEEFAGLSVVLTFQEWSDGAPTPCLFILPAGEDESILGAGCGAGDFEPTTAIEVTTRSPAELLERFSAGSAVQFVLDDGEVIVYSHGP